MSDELSKLFLAFVKHEHQTYKMFIDNIWKKGEEKGNSNE